MTRPDPHAGYVPGQPCGPSCTLCRQPLPDVGPVNPIEASMKRDLYESQRSAHRRIHNLPSRRGRSSTEVMR